MTMPSRNDPSNSDMTMPNQDTLLPGFQTPSLDAQRAFRALLDAWARPGTIATIDGLDEAPQGFDLASASLALTLVDQDTPVWLSDSMAPAADWLRFHCGCPIADDPFKAVFAFARADDALDLDRFNTGAALSPEEGATLVLQAEGLNGGAKMKLTGPGIRTEQPFQISGVPARLWSKRAEIAVDFPAGLDIILTSGARLISIPRTTRLSWET